MLDFSAHALPYASQRSPVHARRGMVATSQPQAAQVGLEILRRGGNAIDAAIATAAALTVVEPTGCGIGGDAFALVWTRGRLHGLDASGRAPGLLDRERVRAAGHERMPLYGWTPVTVPGCPAAWAELSRRFGKLPFEQLLWPAIELARDGFPVSPVIARLWQSGLDSSARRCRSGPSWAWFDEFLIDGRAPRAGEVFRQPGQADTLDELARSQCESFYRGELARAIVGHAERSGGYLRAEDLAGYQAKWVEPISLNYRGYDVWEIPPSGQGLIALMTLNILKGFGERDCARTWHRQLEAMKLAYVDGLHYISQPQSMRVSVEELLHEDYAASRRALIGERALDPSPGQPRPGGTVYLACGDEEGNLVSFIQSNYHGFGSGVVVPGTGIALQNRGAEFSLDPDHVNCLEPGKQTFHTIIPGFLSKDGVPLGPFGVMGAYAAAGPRADGDEPGGLRPQPPGCPRRAALAVAGRAARRHRTCRARALAAELAQRGHQVEIAYDSTSYGRGQIVLRDPASGVLCGGTEPRTDSQIAVW